VAKRIVGIVPFGVELHLLIVQLGVRKGTGAVNGSITGVGLLDRNLALRILIEEALTFQLNLLIIQLSVGKGTRAINGSILSVGTLHRGLGLLGSSGSGESNNSDETESKFFSNHKSVSGISLSKNQKVRCVCCSLDMLGKNNLCTSFFKKLMLAAD